MDATSAESHVANVKLLSFRCISKYLGGGEGKDKKIAYGPVSFHRT
jgi:hypothetical protein